MRQKDGKIRILLVHEDTARAGQIVVALERAEHEVSRVAAAAMPRTRFEIACDLVVVVATDPALVTSLRALVRAPFLVVGSSARSADIVAMLDAGADDYLPLPHDPAVFLARVRALLRRSSGTVLKLGRLSVDPESHLVLCDKNEILLTRSEFRLLVALMREPGETLSRARLIEEVQGEGVSVVARTVDTQIHGLRRKLGKCSTVIETVRRQGYRIRQAD